MNIGYTDILMRYHSFFVKMMVSWYRRWWIIPFLIWSSERYSILVSRIAQLAEHLICNQKVVGSIPTLGSCLFREAMDSSIIVG